MGVLVYFDEYGVQLNSIKNKDVEFYFGYDIWTYKKYIPDPIFEISTELRLAVSKTMGIPAHMLGDSGKGLLSMKMYHYTAYASTALFPIALVLSPSMLK